MAMENLQFRLKDWYDEEIGNKFTSLPKNAQKTICNGMGKSDDILSKYSWLLSDSKDDRLKIYQLCNNLIEKCEILNERKMMHFLNNVKKVAMKTYHGDGNNIVKETNEIYLKMTGREHEIRIV